MNGFDLNQKSSIWHFSTCWERSPQKSTSQTNMSSGVIFPLTAAAVITIQSNKASESITAPPQTSRIVMESYSQFLPSDPLCSSKSSDECVDTGAAETVFAAESCPSKLFARSLKTYGSISFQSMAHMDKFTKIQDAVIAFDVQFLYLQRCSVGSPQFDNNLCLDLVADEVFIGGEVWGNRDLTCSALKAQLDCQGFTIKTEKGWMGCNRYGKPSSQRVYVTGTLQANCTLRLSMNSLKKERVSNELNTKWNYRDDWKGPI